MNRFIAAALLVAPWFGAPFAVGDALCQAPPKESGTIEALLVEVHQLRQDIEAMTVASQRVQIALYGLQMQDGAVARASQRVNDQHNKCSGVQVNRDHLAAETQSLETALSVAAQPEDARTLQTRIAQLKKENDLMTGELQSCQASEAEASNQLRSEQSRLTELQDRIERLDKGLANLADSKR